MVLPNEYNHYKLYFNKYVFNQKSDAISCSTYQAMIPDEDISIQNYFQTMFWINGNYLQTSMSIIWTTHFCSTL